MTNRAADGGHAEAQWRFDTAALLHRAMTTVTTPSAVCAAAPGGRMLAPVADGDGVRFGAGGVELAREARTEAHPDTVYDLASVTKVFTAVTVLTCVHPGPAASGIQQLRAAAADIAYRTLDRASDPE